MVEGFDWLKKWARFSPSRIAIKEIDSGKSVSYSEFYKLSQSLAFELKNKFSVGFGDRVAVLSTNELEYVILFYAVQRLGAILVPVNFRLAPREIAHILKDSAPKLLVLQKEFQDNYSKTELQIPVFNMEALQEFVSVAAPVILDFDPRVKNKTTCMILYTSGTTGAPKGAMIHQEMLYWNSINTTLRLNISQNDKTLIFMPFFHTGGWNVLTTPFFHRGAEIILLKKFDPTRVLEITEKEKLTILFAVPTMMEMMAQTAQFEKTDFSSVRYAIVGGEPSSLPLIKKWNEKGVPFRQGYGLTEFGPNVFSLNEEDSVRKIGSIGFPNFYIETKIVDAHDKECKAGETGELCLKGLMCTDGYWNNSEATKQSIKDGWFHTGDLVKKDEEGYHYVVGRKKEMYISGAENVYPAEIEQVLRLHPAVKEAAVIGVSDEKWGEVGKAFVVLKSPLDKNVLKDYCVENLAKFKVPKHFMFLNELPKSDSGKILKRALS